MSRLLRELEFHLGEVLGLSEVLKQPRFGDIDRGIATAMLEAAAELAEAKFAPCAARLDADEPRWEGGRVVLPLEMLRKMGMSRRYSVWGCIAFS